MATICTQPQECDLSFAYDQEARKESARVEQVELLDAGVGAHLAGNRVEPCLLGDVQVIQQAVDPPCDGPAHDQRVRHAASAVLVGLPRRRETVPDDAADAAVPRPVDAVRAARAEGAEDGSLHGSSMKVGKHGNNIGPSLLESQIYS